MAEMSEDDILARAQEIQRQRAANAEAEKQARREKFSSIVQRDAFVQLRDDLHEVLVADPTDPEISWVVGWMNRSIEKNPK